MQIIRADIMSDTDFVWTEQANAPKSGSVVCAWTELPDRTLHEVHFGGSEEAFQLLLFRNRDALHGYVNKCPHHWLTMNRRSDGEFMMWAEDELMCVHHCAVFKLTDAGRCIDGPCLGTNLVNVPVVVLDGQVLIGE